MKILPVFILSIFSTILLAQDTAYVCNGESASLLPLENVNSKSLEFSPTYYQNGLVFVVARERNSLLDPKTGQAYFDLMYADLGPDGMADKAVFFSPNLTRQYHEGPCTLSSAAHE